MDKAKLIKFADKVIKKYMEAAIDNLGYIAICDNIDMDDSKQAIEEECNALRYEFSKLLDADKVRGDVMHPSNSEAKLTTQMNKREVKSEPAVISLLLNDKTMYPVTQQQVNHWQELYQACNVIVELKKMKGWLEANPTKRKTRSGILRFITSWLSRCQNSGAQNAWGKTNDYRDFDVYKSDIDHDAMEKIIMGKLYNPN